ncbi:cupin domain-containing protein [Streptomyces sp. IBSBF 3136]|uniref:cupin domain-containing protein n=1 Tax=Streptomyces sp. IBSBF 3136 TaxID=2903524 RepID=UPI002FDC3E74
MTSSSAFDTGSAGEPDAEPRLLCDAGALADAPPLPDGVLWKLAESGRQLDANVVRLAPGDRVASHREPHLDVLVLVVRGDGVLGKGSADAPEPLAEGALLWLPHGSTRSITAGGSGLTYLTVHRRRPGIRIQSRAATAPAQP